MGEVHTRFALSDYMEIRDRHDMDEDAWDGFIHYAEGVADIDVLEALYIQYYTFSK